MKPGATAGRHRPHWHAPEKGTGPAFVLSLIAHALLFLSIAFVVRWKTEPVGTVSAELWGGFPAAPAAAPAPAPAPPPPAPVVEPVPPPPPPKAEPRPEPEPERKADIVLEKKPEPPKKIEPPKPDPKKLEEQRKLEAQKKLEEQKKIEAEKREAQKKQEAQKLEALKREAAKAEAAAAKSREQALQRMTAAAGGPATGSAAGAPGATGIAGGGFSRGYEAQVVGCVRPHIVFNVPDGVQPKQYVAEFEVQLLPTGEQATAPRLLKASGLASYDQAVERAIRRCDPFPRPREGSMPRTLRLTFDPVDTR